DVCGGGTRKSRRDGGHRDPVAAEPDGQRAHHSDQRALRRHVREQVRARGTPKGVGHDENHAAKAAISHPRGEGLRKQECRLDVDRLDPAPHVEVELVERPEGDHRRRVDKDVAPAVAIEHEPGGPAYTSSGSPRSTTTSPVWPRMTTVWSGASRAAIAPPIAPAPPV